MKKNNISPIFNMPPVPLQTLAAKVKQMIGGGGDTPTPTPKTLDDYVYYGGQDTELDVSDVAAVAAVVETWDKTKKYTTSNIPFDDVYEYFSIPAQYQIDTIKTDNNEDITDEFIEKLSNYTQGDKSYNLYQYSLDSGLPLEVNVTLKVK